MRHGDFLGSGDGCNVHQGGDEAGSNWSVSHVNSMEISSLSACSKCMLIYHQTLGSCPAKTMVDPATAEMLPNSGMAQQSWDCTQQMQTWGFRDLPSKNIQTVDFPSLIGKRCVTSSTIMWTSWICSI